MGTGGQGVGDGQSPRQRTVHGPWNPTGSDAHHTRREPAARTSGEEQNCQLDVCKMSAAAWYRVDFKGLVHPKAFFL